MGVYGALKMPPADRRAPGGRPSETDAIRETWAVGVRCGKPVIVVDQRELIRGCLTFWLGGFGQELVVTSMSDVTTSLEFDLLRRASAVVVGAGASVTADAWLERQVAWLLANRPDAPIVLIMELQEARAVGALFGRLHLRGYVPTSSSMELAAAALQLVIAGGTYFPRARDEDSAPSAPPALIELDAHYRIDPAIDAPRMVCAGSP